MGKLKLYLNIIKIGFKSFIWAIKNRKTLIEDNDEYKGVISNMKKSLKETKIESDKQHMTNMLQIKLDLEEDLAQIDARLLKDLVKL